MKRKSSKIYRVCIKRAHLGTIKSNIEKFSVWRRRVTNVNWELTSCVGWRRTSKPLGLLARGYNGKWLEVEAHVISESELGLVTHFPMNQVYVSAVLWSHIHTLTTSPHTHIHIYTHIHSYDKRRGLSTVGAMLLLPARCCLWVVGVLVGMSYWPRYTRRIMC